MALTPVRVLLIPRRRCLRQGCRLEQLVANQAGEGPVGVNAREHHQPEPRIKTVDRGLRVGPADSSTVHHRLGPEGVESAAVFGEVGPVGVEVLQVIEGRAFRLMLPAVAEEYLMARRNEVGNDGPTNEDRASENGDSHQRPPPQNSGLMETSPELIAAPARSQGSVTSPTSERSTSGIPTR